MARSVFAVLSGAAASAALSTLLLFLVSALLAGNTTDIGLLPVVLAAWISVAFLANAVGAIVLGLPWHLIAQKNDWRASWHYWLPGAVCGFVVAFLFVNGGALLAGNANSVFRWGGALFPAYLYGAALGGFTALFAWRIRRPDRDAANPPTSTS